jgi:hypothetical protein
MKRFNSPKIYTEPANIGNKVEDIITYLETFLGESAKVLSEQWVEGNPGLYE